MNNPAQGFLKPLFSQSIQNHTHWSYWQDLSQITQTQRIDNSSLWDNQGVQYGLEGLRQGTISIQEFIHLNYHIGGWKPQSQQQPEQLLFIPFVRTPIWLTQWSRLNIHFAKNGPAKRTTANSQTIETAYRYGQVFLGVNPIPTIDIHHYLEEELDMHHISTSFATRLRIENYQGHTNNQKIWVSHKDFTPLKEAFTVIDSWLTNDRMPEDASDRCFDKNGDVIAEGHAVWSGKWNKQTLGKCTQAYPIYSNSRIQAGGPWQGSIFKCHKIPVRQAIAQGIYKPLDMTPYIKELEDVFPHGVCDFKKGDLANPFNWLSDRSS